MRCKTCSTADANTLKNVCARIENEMRRGASTEVSRRMVAETKEPGDPPQLPSSALTRILQQSVLHMFFPPAAPTGGQVTLVQAKPVLYLPPSKWKEFERVDGEADRGG